MARAKSSAARTPAATGRKSAAGSPRRAIVSSAHLASEKLEGLSEFEFALMMTGNAFARWIVRCMAAANAAMDGQGDLAALDVMVLHGVNHRERPKRLADLCLVLNVEDSHTVNYGLKKMVRLGLVSGTRKGKEIFYSTTPKGQALCLEYRKIREQLLGQAFALIGQPRAGQAQGDLSRVAELMRALSGIYDQAARSAASL
ncbi:winged helix DNA-binding protein [Ferrovibrio sp.]|uniref:winged helix DNA-binding protein n=1 Tax=Ferrovibrio sp. TaxID=1917215 RepID=UPI00311D805B